MEKPTIEEIEELLDGKQANIVIMPNGEIKSACENCLKLKERIVELEKSLQPSNAADNEGALCLCPKYFGDCEDCENGKCKSPLI